MSDGAAVITTTDVPTKKKRQQLSLDTWVQRKKKPRGEKKAAVSDSALLNYICLPTYSKNNGAGEVCCFEGKVNRITPV